MTTLRRVDYGPHVRAVDVGPGLRLLEYFDGTWRFEHPCKMLGPDEQLVCAPLLQTSGADIVRPALIGHQVVRAPAGVTVSPSIHCTDCGTHGHVTDGVWRSC